MDGDDMQDDVTLEVLCDAMGLRRYELWKIAKMKAARLKI